MTTKNDSFRPSRVRLAGRFDWRSTWKPRSRTELQMNFDPTVQSPSTLAEAYALLSEPRHSMKIIAGGTDVMVLMNAHVLDTAEFLNIWGVDELRGIEDDGNGLRIGALTTYTQLINSPLIQQHAPSLVAASRTIGAIQIQNRGTIGGNIVNASPAGDSLPVLAAYDVEVEIGSARGTRRIAFNEFYAGYRRTLLQADELVVAVRIPKLKEGERDFFWKVGTRRAQAISKTVLAARARMNGETIEAMNIGIGSVAPTVIRASDRTLTYRQDTHFGSRGTGSPDDGEGSHTDQRPSLDRTLPTHRNGERARQIPASASRVIQFPRCEPLTRASTRPSGPSSSRAAQAQNKLPEPLPSATRLFRRM